MNIDLLYTLFEWVALIAGVACVWLLIKQNIWTFPIGLLFSVVTLAVLIQQKLYANSIETTYYLIMNAYGWWWWKSSQQGAGGELAVTRMPTRWWLWLFGLAAMTTWALGSFLASYTDADLAYIDSATTSAAFIAMWMSARKYVQSWPLWLAVDIAYVGLYLYKDLPTYAVLYVIYIGLAVVGWQAWQRNLNNAH